MSQLSAAFLLVAGATVHPNPAHRDPVRAYIERTFGPSTYKRAEADLDGDGQKEIFVYFTDADSCGSGGCMLLILSPIGGHYRVLLRSTITRLPIMLLATSTRGWRDVGVTVQGGGINPSYEARLRFNGLRYPSNPSMSPAIPMRHRAGKVLISP